MRLLASFLLFTSALAWKFQVTVARDGAGDSHDPDKCINFDLKKGEKLTWTEENGKEPGLKKCCAFLYQDSGCPKDHVAMEYKNNPILARYGSQCKTYDGPVDMDIRSMKVECKARPWDRVSSIGLELQRVWDGKWSCWSLIEDHTRKEARFWTLSKTYPTFVELPSNIHWLAHCLIMLTQIYSNLYYVTTSTGRRLVNQRDRFI